LKCPIDGRDRVSRTVVVIWPLSWRASGKGAKRKLSNLFETDVYHSVRKPGYA